MDSLYLDTFGDLPCNDRDAELEALLCGRCRGKPRHLLCYRCRLALIAAEKGSKTTKSSLELACSRQHSESGEKTLSGLGLARITVPRPPSLPVAPEPSHRQANVKNTATTAAPAAQHPPSQADHRDNTSHPCYSNDSQSYRAHSCSNYGGSSGGSRACRRACSGSHTRCDHPPPYHRDCPRCDSGCYLSSGPGPRPIRHAPCHYNNHHVRCCDCCNGCSGSCYTAGPDWPFFSRPSHRGGAGGCRWRHIPEETTMPTTWTNGNGPSPSFVELPAARPMLELWSAFYLYEYGKPPLADDGSSLPAAALCRRRDVCGPLTLSCGRAMYPRRIFCHPPVGSVGVSLVVPVWLDQPGLPSALQSGEDRHLRHRACGISSVRGGLSQPLLGAAEYTFIGSNCQTHHDYGVLGRHHQLTFSSAGPVLSPSFPASVIESPDCYSFAPLPAPHILRANSLQLHNRYMYGEIGNS
jgi:hypothetical protein